MNDPKSFRDAKKCYSGIDGDGPEKNESNPATFQKTGSADRCKAFVQINLKKQE